MCCKSEHPSDAIKGNSFGPSRIQGSDLVSLCRRSRLNRNVGPLIVFLVVVMGSREDRRCPRRFCRGVLLSDSRRTQASRPGSKGQRRQLETVACKIILIGKSPMASSNLIGDQRQYKKIRLFVVHPLRQRRRRPLRIHTDRKSVV